MSTNCTQTSEQSDISDHSSWARKRGPDRNRSLRPAPSPPRQPRCYRLPERILPQEVGASAAQCTGTEKRSTDPNRVGKHPQTQKPKNTRARRETQPARYPRDPPALVQLRAGRVRHLLLIDPRTELRLLSCSFAFSSSLSQVPEGGDFGHSACGAPSCAVGWICMV